MSNIYTVAAAMLVVCVLATARAQEEEGVGERILESRISLDLEKGTLRKVVQEIARKTAMQYMAPDEILDDKRTVTIHIKDRPVREVLEFLAEHLELDIDGGRLEETGVLVLSGRRPRGPAFDPQLDHAQALKLIQSHPTVAQAMKDLPRLWINLEWDRHDRAWHGELVQGDEEVGGIELREFDKQKPRIVRVELDRERLARDAAPARKKGNGEEAF